MKPMVFVNHQDGRWCLRRGRGLWLTLILMRVTRPGEYRESPDGARRAWVTQRPDRARRDPFSREMRPWLSHPAMLLHWRLSQSRRPRA